MKDWGIIIAVALAFIFLTRSIYHVGSVLGFRLDELHKKVDDLMETLEEIKEK